MTRLLLSLAILAAGVTAAVLHFYSNQEYSNQKYSNQKYSNQEYSSHEQAAPMATPAIVATIEEEVPASSNSTETAAIEPHSPAPEAKAQKPPITATQIALWIEQTGDEDPAVRAAAIDALASAPKSKAVPVLLQTMRGGIDGDRQRALDSLHTIAVDQGDENDEIRTALRLVIYDGDDEVMINSAQIALEDIEYDPAAIAPAATP